MGDSGQISTFVRNWLHYENLASSFYRQAARARQVRDEFEAKIISFLHSTKMDNAVIQINGGRLNVVEERNPKTLSLIRIEELLHGYFEHRGGRDETSDIMTYIRNNRGVDIVKKLRKTGGVNLPALPPVPPATS